MSRSAHVRDCISGDNFTIFTHECKEFTRTQQHPGHTTGNHSINRIHTIRYHPHKRTDKQNRHKLQMSFAIKIIAVR